MEMKVEQKENPILKLFKPKQIDLVATIRFGTHTIKTTYYGEIKIGLNKGKLQAVIENGKVSLDNMQLFNPLPLERDVQVKDEVTNEMQFGVKGEVNVSVKPKIGGSLGAEKKIGRKRSEEYQDKKYVVETAGGESDPIWIFTLTGEVLKGLLKKETLATIDVTKNPCTVVCTFQKPELEDIKILKGTGLLKVLENLDLTEKEAATMIERSVAKFILQNNFRDCDYLSYSIVSTVSK